MTGTTRLLKHAQRLALPAGAALICALVVGPASLATSAANVTVTLTDSAPPSPALANVAPGDTVTFLNTGKENHDVVSARAGFTTPLLLPGQSTSVTMNTVGKFTYKQTGFTHTFSGTIVVASASAQGQLSLNSRDAFVPYGFRTTLRASTSLPDGTKLVLYSHSAAGARAPRKCAAAPTPGQAQVPAAGWVRASAPIASSAGGVTFGVRPAAATSYRVATADAAVCSSAVVVRVRPRVTIRLSSMRIASGRQVTVTGTVAPARAATALVLSRLNLGTSTWRKVATASTSIHGTSHFIFVVPAGATRLQVATTKSGGRGAYLPGLSPSLVVHGVGPMPQARATRHTHHH